MHLADLDAGPLIPTLAVGARVVLVGGRGAHPDVTETP